MTPQVARTAKRRDSTEAGEPGPIEPPVMEGAGHERAGDAIGGEGFEIRRPAHAAGGVDPARRRPGADLSQPLMVGAGAAADPGQRHDDEVPGPELRPREEGRGPEPLGTLEVQGEGQSRLAPELLDEPEIGLALAAENEPAEPGIEEAPAIATVVEAGVDPEVEPGEVGPQAAEGAPMIALLPDRIEIGDVDGAEGVETQEAIDHGSGIGAAAEHRAVERAIAVPLPGPGMDDLTAHQVDHRQDLEIGHRWPVLRVLVVEWITGGGCLAQPLPVSLAAEGLLMADRLLADLVALPECEVRATRDWRLPPAPAPVTTIRLDEPCDLPAALRRLLAPGELLWPIAPETDGALEALASIGRDAGIRVMASEPATIRLAASKLATSRHLAAAGLWVAPTAAPGEAPPPSSSGWVLKPDDGAGCLGTRRVADAARLATAWNEQKTAVAQPWIAGEPLSLSMLCAHGQARLLSCNRQLVHQAADGLFHFEGVIVGGAEQHRVRLEPLAAAIAAAMPGLFGHIGVDLVLTAEGPVLLEVNPRLTTAYAGLGEALGVNAAALALDLLADLPPSRDCLRPTRAVAVRPEQAHG